MRKSYLALLVAVVLLTPSSTLGWAEGASLDGTMWMYEHESGARHYIAFYGQYHYLNSSFGEDLPEASWLRSTYPYGSTRRADGSMHYRATHISSGAWAFNWGSCDIINEEASFSALGMLYTFFVYNRNEPYLLMATDWHPPQLFTGSEGVKPATSAIPFPALFGLGF